ncbi:Cell division ATP-binding protein FtsE [Fundidesulfovibrio magnetotacticus]|uniref:Cell division ATP-binding protein FtsE n=1 Tax=Fundidesulfovibrio magnetotacticus TaxID=2730080 RepID=A0A6V8LV72_9BACT|nr:ATP-binding cassette domain-containing protein [Fundidesulfovibrio magnetotacticus]GFK93716.1 Cell division ATP-binding protein FtsE [Fundidesulfovibrio magnetotacticus]
MISAVQLTHAFDEHLALRAVSFRVRKGEFCFLTGHSGAGKTTLLRLLHGDLPVQRGKASIAGYDLSGLPRKNLPFLRRDVAVVFQDFKILMDRTVRENVSLPLEVCGLPREQIVRRVDSVLASLHLTRMAELPCLSLSGGEQQRVAIARAMAGGPKVILADEPTGNLDLNLAQRLMEVFKQFHAHGVTILMATHNMELVRATPQARVLSLEAGFLLAGGEEEDEQGQADDGIAPEEEAPA